MSTFAPGSAHLICRALVVDREGRVLRVRDPAELPGARAGAADRTLLEAALRGVTVRTGLAPGDLCLTPELLTAPVHVEAVGPAHYEFTFALCLARELPAPLEADWLPVGQLPSGSLKARLRALNLDGRPAPVNASALIHDGDGRYLLHLRDNIPGIWERGYSAREDTLRPEPAEGVPGLDPACPYAVEEATGTDGLRVPQQVFSRAPEVGGTELNIVGVHLYAEDDRGRVLLGLRHPDAAFAGSTWHFLAGHCERESAVACLVREAYEEAGLVIDPADLELAHVVHLLDGPSARPRLQLVFRARRLGGTPRLREPDKCLAWRWWDPDALPEPLVSYARTAIDGIRAGRTYSELGWCPA
ncbi:NUDIX hydrolase [Streptomyces griseoluteus]|uniref:NUDIX hydrolase n=1 Tax=Streptomyces griseoluteus TaxID=29306 RepID=UPI0036FCCAB1